jgi:hypothetical protein
MTHRAGPVREPPVGSYFDSTRPPLAEVVKSLNTTELVYAPATYTKYSNAGDSVAGFIFESLVHKPHTAFARGSAAATPAGEQFFQSWACARSQSGEGTPRKGKGSVLAALELMEHILIPFTVCAQHPVRSTQVERAEVAEVFRRILASGLSLDEVEISCATGTYATLMWLVRIT